MPQVPILIREDLNHLLGSRDDSKRVSWHGLIRSRLLSPRHSWVGFSWLLLWCWRRQGGLGEPMTLIRMKMLLLPWQVSSVVPLVWDQGVLSRRQSGRLWRLQQGTPGCQGRCWAVRLSISCWQRQRDVLRCPEKHIRQALVKFTPKAQVNDTRRSPQNTGKMRSQQN